MNEVVSGGQSIRVESGRLVVGERPVIPFIEGDGTGPDIWRAARKVFDAAVAKAYGGRRAVAWLEVYAGEKAFRRTGQWLPEETIQAFQRYVVGIKGPLTTPVGGGIRSLNVALRQVLDLYVCLRPVRYFAGAPSPVKHPEKVDMVIFRENAEDIYAGIEFQHGASECEQFKQLLAEHFPERFRKIRFPNTCGFGVKPVSQEGTMRLVRAAIAYALAHRRKSVTLVHKGNIMKFTEGAFRDWGYQVARDEYGAQPIEQGPWCMIEREGQQVVIKDALADNFLQQILTRPEEYDVIATLNLNGDYISDALAAQVGGIGIAPGGNINYETGHAVFEATHGTAPKYANQDKVNPSSLILSGEMMFRHLGWHEAADLIIQGIQGAIANRTVTYDLARLMGEEAAVQEVSCSGFAQAVVEHMGQ